VNDGGSVNEPADTAPLSAPLSSEFKARRFYLLRKEDVSGVSGTGKVAEGVEFLNGVCALSFSSSHMHVNVYMSIRAVAEVHGHGGATEVVWVD
jgi:hypothetical protein